MSTPVDRFAADIDRFVQKLDAPVELVMRRLALQVFVGVVQKTPVDTGRARASWEIGVNRTPMGVAARGGYGGEAAGASAAKTQVLSQVKKGDFIVIANNLPYIVPLEKGSSTQAPRGMVAVTLEEIAAQLRSVVG